MVTNCKKGKSVKRDFSTHSDVVNLGFLNKFPVLLQIEVFLFLVAISSSEIRNQRPNSTKTQNYSKSNCQAYKLRSISLWAQIICSIRYYSPAITLQKYYFQLPELKMNVKQYIFEKTIIRNVNTVFIYLQQRH